MRAISLLLIAASLFSCTPPDRPQPSVSDVVNDRPGMVFPSPSPSASASPSPSPVASPTPATP